MKKRTMIIIVIALLAAIVFATLLVWWLAPVSLLADVEARDVSRIRVFNGSTGMEFYIEDAESIEKIVNGIKNAELYKSGISKNEDGFTFSLYFYNGETVIDELIVNGSDTIRKYPFFYEDRTGGLPFDTLNELERIK